MGGAALIAVVKYVWVREGEVGSVCECVGVAATVWV